MEHCPKCNKDTESRPNFIKQKLVCKVCGAEKGPLPPSDPRSQPEVAIERTECKAIVSVSTDEWVIMKKSSGAWLYTQDLIGCVALVVESRDRIALAHVLDRNAPPHTDNAEAAHQLDLIVAVLGKANIKEIHLILTGDRDTPTYTLVRGWGLKYVKAKDLEVHRGANCVMVHPDVPDVVPGRKVKVEERRLLKNPATGVKWITNWGKLPQWQGHTGS